MPPEESNDKKTDSAGGGKLGGIAAIITALATLATAIVPLIIGNAHSKGEPNPGVVEKYEKGISIIVNNVFRPGNNADSDHKTEVDSRYPAQKIPSKPASNSATTEIAQPPAILSDAQPAAQQNPSAVSCPGLPTALKLVRATADWAKPSTYLVRLIVQNSSSQPISLLSAGSEQLTDDDKNRLAFVTTSLLRHDWDSREQFAMNYFKAGAMIEPGSESSLSYTFSGADKAAKTVSISSNLFYVVSGGGDKFVPYQRNFTCEDIPVR